MHVFFLQEVLLTHPGFTKAKGTLFVVYKVDGNGIGHGGNCNNGIIPIVPTPIMLQELAADGTTPVGDPIQNLDRDDGDSPLVVAPNVITASCVYFLFFPVTALAVRDTTFLTRPRRQSRVLS